MPVTQTTAYQTAEDVLNLARALINDARIAGGDVLTDNAPFTFLYLNAAYHQVQFALATAGVETFVKEAILNDIPASTSTDTGAQVYVSDSGTFDGTTLNATPQLPVDLIVPLRIWERKNATSPNTNTFVLMNQKSDGLPTTTLGATLDMWEWRYDGIYMPGATQANDLRVRYHAALPDMSATSDPVQIRGVDNAMALLVAAAFALARGAPQAVAFEQAADRMIERMRLLTSRREFHAPLRASWDNPPPASQTRGT
jgi:hypothetical protein